MISQYFMRLAFFKIIICKCHTPLLLSRSVCSNGSFGTHRTDHFLCTSHMYRSVDFFGYRK